MRPARVIPWLTALAVLAFPRPAEGGTALLYASYLGGSETETAYAMAVDRDGNTYLASCTRSPDCPES
jgi:hypothetical protein